MLLPASIADLSQTASVNSPPGTEAPSVIDDSLRVYASYIAALRDGPGFVTGVRSNVLGSAGVPAFSFVGDTDTGLFSSGSNAMEWVTGGTTVVAINAARNVTMSAPGSGTTLTVNGVTGVPAFGVRSSDEAGGYILSITNTNASVAQFFVSHAGAVTNIGSARTDAAATVNIFAGNAARVAVGAFGNVSINTPSSGYALSLPPRTPASATDTGVLGSISWDASFFYVCTATNTWRRTAHATW